MQPPPPWGEPGHIGSRVLADAREDIDQIGIGVDFMPTAGGNQALGNAPICGPNLDPAEGPVAAPHRHHAQGALQVIGVDRHLGVGQLHLRGARRSRTSTMAVMSEEGRRGCRLTAGSHLRPYAHPATSPAH